MTNETAPVLDQINLVVGDMDAMVGFYRRLGVAIPDPSPPWDAHHRSAETGHGIDLDFDGQQFASTWNHGLPSGQTRVVIGFKLSDRDAVDRAFAHLTAAGYVGQQEPYDAFWGSRYAVVEDPDGNSVGLMSPIEPDRRTAPPTPPG